MKRREENVRRCQSAVKKEKREHELERRSVRSKTKVCRPQGGSAENNTSFFGQVFRMSLCRVVE